MAPVTLSNTSAILLPPTITGPIFTKAAEASAVMSLARKVPLSVSAQTAIPVPMDIPAAGWVAEGGVKPVASGAIGVKIMTGKKVALLIPVSSEVVMTNPAGLYDQMEQDLPTAIARAFDHAAIHGVDLRTGAAGPFTDFLKATPNSIELGTTSQATGGMYADLVKGEMLVVNANYDFTGFAADPRLKPLLKLQTDTLGRPIWDNDSPGDSVNSGQIIGYPAYFNRGVSGNYLRDGNKVQVVTLTGGATGGTFNLSSGGNTTAVAFNATGANVQTAIRAWGGAYAAVTVAGAAGGPYTVTFPLVGSQVQASAAGLTGGTPVVSVAQTNANATPLRAVGGDWSQCAYGVGMDISIKISDTASYVDEAAVVHSAFQENLTLLLVEAYYGFVVGQNSAFVCYLDAV